MHSKTKGILGEAAVIKDLVAQDLSVFVEFGDNCKTDFVVLVDSTPVKVQVKARAVKDGAVCLVAKKTGPNYRFKYKREDVDVFALYVLGEDVVLYISADELISRSGGLTIRMKPPKNGQSSRVNSPDKYRDFRTAAGLEGL